MQLLSKMRLAVVGGVLLAVAAGPVAAKEGLCDSGAGGSALAAEHAQAFSESLSAGMRATLARPFGKSAAIGWSNLPVGLVPRAGVRIGDLSAEQTAAFDKLMAAVLSRCGVELLAEIRAADEVLKPLDTRNIKWDPREYYIALLGAPSAKTPWILQVGGHHIAYNLSFNTRLISATPLFDGVEPVEFRLRDRDHEPLAAQAGAMRALASALANTPRARLAGTFRDVTRGATDGGDTNFPISYPTDPSDRGVRYTELSSAQQALVRTAMARWVELPNGAVGRPLMAQYVAPAALADTFVGVSGDADLSRPGSYVRIDGPRVWIEFIVQPAVADKTRIHYHTIWRDKVADYGGAFGK